MKNENGNSLAHGIGAALVALLGMFGRCADDVARIGVHGVDDVGRAWISTSDDVGRTLTNSGDDVLRASSKFRFADDFAGFSETRIPEVTETHDGLATAVHLTKDVAEVTIKLLEGSNRENEK